MTEDETQFSLSMRGYNRAEVDRILANFKAEIQYANQERDELREQIAALQSQAKVMQAQIERAESKPNYSSLGAQFAEVLRMAEQKAEKLLADAEAQASGLTQDSEARASKLIRDAEIRAKKIIDDANARGQELKVSSESDAAEISLKANAALAEASARRDEALSFSHKDAVLDLGATARRLGGLAVTPKAGTAILFYNLDPDDGTPSPAVSDWVVHVHGDRFRKAA